MTTPARPDGPGGALRPAAAPKRTGGSKDVDSSEARHVLEAERKDLEAEIDKREAAARRHAFWAVLGVSPGAVIPLLFTVSEVGAAALVAGVVAMTGMEAWRAHKARRDVGALRRDLEELRRLPPPAEIGD